MKCYHVLFVSFLVGGNAQAQDRVYTTVDAQGRLQQIISDNVSEESFKSKQLSNGENAVVNQGSTSKEFDNEQYIDSVELEKRIYNSQDKKRFYYIPNGTLGEKIVESDNNRPSIPHNKKELSEKKQLSFSDNYLIITQKELANSYPHVFEFCKKTKQLKSSGVVKNTNAVWVQQADFVFRQPDKILHFDGVQTKEQFFRIVNYAQRLKKPFFYLPMVVFFDNDACPLEAAWNYWSRSNPANDNHFEFLEGLLGVPIGTKYILLYSLDKASQVDLKLQNYGSLVLENWSK